MDRLNVNRVLKFICAFILMFGCVILSVKMVFSGYVADDSYHLAMSFRHAFGDRLFFEMWEPHQTSSFLCSFLIKVYVVIKDSAEGLVIFLRICGLFFQAVVALIFFFCLKDDFSRFNVFVASVLLYASFPKLSALPEVSNMLMWFTTIAVSLMWKAMSAKKYNILYMSIATLFMCLSIVTYQTAIILFIPFLFFVYQVKKKDSHAFFVYILICVCCGCSYVFAVSRGQIFYLFSAFRNIIEGDSSHLSGENLIGKPPIIANLQDFGVLLCASVILICLISFCVHLSCKSIGKTKKIGVVSFISAFMSLLPTAYMVFAKASGYDCVKLYYIVASILFLLTLNNIEESKERKYYLIISVATGYVVVVANALVSNLMLQNNIPYLQISLVFALLGIAEFTDLSKDKLISYGKETLIIVTIVTMAVNIYTQKPAGNWNNIFQYNAKFSFGPGKGVYSDWIVVDSLQKGNVLLNNNVNNGDSVMIISNNLFVPASYLYLNKDIKVSQYSTICTPTYGEKYEDYYLMYNDRVPNVIVIDKSTYEYSVTSWVYGYLHEEYEYEVAAENEYYIVERMNY